MKLYSRGREVPEEVMDLVVRRTKGASPAFIKELMRRSAHFQVEMCEGEVLHEPAVDGAIEEMVFIGGALNLSLLGAPRQNSVRWQSCDRIYLSKDALRPFTAAYAILDRLLHHSTTINIRGESYRLKDRRQAGLLPRPEDQPPPLAEPAAIPAAALGGRSKRSRSL